MARPSSRSPAPDRARELSLRDLEESALRYLNRFDASAQKLERHLNRVARRAKNETDLLALVPKLIERYQGSGLIDDRRFAESRARSLRERGASARLIQQKLGAQGVPRDVVDEVLRGGDSAPRSARDQELEAAVAYVRRKRLGAHRPEEQQALERQRDLARLARQGFDFDTARRALALGRGDEF